MSTGALLTIISGTPGTGKTALAVSTVLDFLEKNPSRPVYVAGIPEFKLPHIPVPPLRDWTVIGSHPDDPSIEYPVFTFPDGALVIVDEAQNFWPSRGAGSKVPSHTAAMERHRHSGIDFILITQGPGMLDPTIRKLCGRYIHIVDTWKGRFTYEWSECVSPESGRRNAVMSRYTLPKKVFGLYKSSSMHVKRTRKIPSFVWFTLLAFGVGSVLAFKAYEIVWGAGAGSAALADVPATAPNVQRLGDALTYPGTMRPPPEPVGSKPQHYVPRMPQRPETAPLYDSIRTVKAMPTVAGCISLASRCKCYTGQGTDAFLTEPQCRAWLDNPPFNPWLDPQQTPAPSARVDPATPS